MFLTSVLQIYFGESDYSISEGSALLSSTITLQFKENQNPFTVRLSPVTIDIIESQGLGHFINFVAPGPEFRLIPTATACQYKLHSNVAIYSSMHTMCDTILVK